MQSKKFIKQHSICKCGQETQKHITLPGHRAELFKAESSNEKSEIGFLSNSDSSENRNPK